MSNRISYYILVLLLLTTPTLQSLNDAVVASGSGDSYSLYLDSQETLLFSSGQSSGLQVFQVSGSNTWTTASPGTLAAVAEYTSINALQTVLSSDENYLFLAAGTNGLKVIDISTKTSWSTSPVTDLSTLVVGTLTGTINTVRLSSDNRFLFVGGASGFVAYDINTLASWTNEDISLLPKFGQITTLTDIVDIDILDNEDFALISAGANGASVLDISGRQQFLNDSLTIAFSEVGTSTWTGVVAFLKSPDNKFAFVATSTAGYIVDIQNVGTWSSQDIEQLVVAQITEAGLSHALWINGANYLATGEMDLYDLRSRESWPAGVVASAYDLTGLEVDTWAQGATKNIIRNTAQHRVYIATGATGIQVLSMLQADGWIITLCQEGTYFFGSSCFPCGAPCATCYDQFSCLTCTGDLQLASSRTQDNSCECPNGYLDQIYLDNTLTNCQAGSTCGAGEVKVNNRCLNEDCLDLSLAIVTTNIKLNVTQAIINTETNFKFLFYYDASLTGNTVASWAECYTSFIYIQKVDGADTFIYQLPIEVSALTVTSYIRFSDLETYGCVVTENATTLSYSCTTYWVNKFFDQEQLSVQAPVTIIISKTTNSSLSINVGQTTTTTTCIGCDQNFQVQSTMQLIDGNGDPLATSQFVLGDTVTFKVTLSDSSLLQIYYLKHIETKLATTGFNLTLTPITRDSTIKGQLISSFQATLAVSGASIVVSSSLQTTLPTYRLRMLQTNNNQQQQVVARLNVSIIDPSQQDNTNKPILVLVIVSTTAVFSGLMVLYHLYESYFRKNVDHMESKKQIQRQNVFNLYQRQVDVPTNEDIPNDQDLPEKQLRRHYQLKVEQLN